MLFALFLGEHLVPPGFERGEAALDAARLSAIEPYGALGQVGQEPAVVADRDKRGAARQEFALEPFDGGEIEMIGGLVEQQDVGRRRKHARQRSPPRLAAGEASRVFAAVEAELLQEVTRLMAIVAGAEARFHIGECRCRAGEIGFLRQIPKRGSGLQEARSVVGLDQSGGHPEQGRLARAIATDQADALADRDGQLGPGEQWCAAEGQCDISELNEGRRHAHPVTVAAAWARAVRAGSPHRVRKERWSDPAARMAAVRASPLPPISNRASGCGPPGSFRWSLR